MAITHRSIVVMLLLAVAPAWSAAAGLRIVDESVASQWPLDGNRVVPPYPAELAGRGEPACVALGYSVDRKGRTSDFVVLRAWTPAGDGDAKIRARLDLFVRNSAAAVAHWRFAAPAGGHGDWPAYTAATFVYLPVAGDAQVARGHCAIGDLSGFIARAQARLRARGSLMIGRMDRKQQSDPPMIPYDKHNWFDGMFGPGN